MNFSKYDFWYAVIAGEAIAILALPVFKNLGIFDIFTNDIIFYSSLGLWLVFLPLVIAVGLYIAYYMTILKWPIFYQIGKYGIIGLLNSFLTLGILNFLILISGIVRGLWFNIFFAIACCGGVTNAFFWNKFWTFDSKKTPEIKKEYIKFFAVTGATTLVNIFLMHVLVNVIGAPSSVNPKAWVNISSAFLIFVSFFGNFFGWKFLVFKA
jgi:putative flippase GtrA